MRKQLLLFFVCLLICSTALLRAQDAAPDYSGIVVNPNVGNSEIPAQTVADKLCPYVWGETRGTLTEAVDDVKALGATCVRVYIGPYFTYPGQNISPAVPLDIRIQDPQYQYLLNAGFKKIIFTLYDSASYSAEYKTAGEAMQARLERQKPRYSPRSLSASDFGNVEDELRRFAFYLGEREGSTDFIISNWEGGNDAVDISLWSIYTKYLQTRISGIIAGRQEAVDKGYSGRVFSGFEFIYLPTYEPAHPSDLVHIGGNLTGVDFWLYSSWRSIGYTDDIVSDIVYPFTGGIMQIEMFLQSHPSFSDKIIIGEFGNNWGIHPDILRMETMFRIGVNLEVDSMCPWVLYNQNGAVDSYGRDDSQYGSFSLDGLLTVQGTEYSRWYSVGIVPQQVYNKPENVPIF